MKGLILNVYKHKGNSYANRGISTRVDEVTVIAVGGDGPPIGPFEPNDARPAVVIRTKQFGDRKYVYAEPQAAKGEGEGEIGYMDGGCYVGTWDSRFVALTGGLSAVPLHDRIETVREYATYSA